MKSKISIGILSILCSVFFMTSCESYPGYDDYVIEDQLVPVSGYNSNTDFAQYKTYSISDTVAIVDNGTTTKVLVSSDPKLQKFVSLVQTNMEKVGYTSSAVKKNADLGIMLSLVKTTNTYVSYPWWWWEYCTWYYWDCGYIPYYPYPYPVVVGGYTVGVLAMDMFDLKNKSNTQVPAVWTGVVRGLYTGTHSDADVSAAINKCFDQTAPFKSKN